MFKKSLKTLKKKFSAAARLIAPPLVKSWLRACNQVVYVPKAMMENVKFNTLHKMGTAISPLYISLHDLYDLANFELSKIEDWFKANKLTLNESNTEYILYKNKKEDVSITSLKLQIDNKDKERVGTGCKNESFKFVGVHLDENLN